ncbi:hypothetical protein [Paractinoplanes abujensis]|uniref:Uncharacterized protein n=1 Tax=Paractinoplanes abujensis TaxID=882441 RepID=A0A7W7CKR4_9ACTN|nr:hypothetical protein [Actinoplanes abujensis]MBB4690109.1 hypothetical protein [Actinoplanes abujensis]
MFAQTDDPDHYLVVDGLRLTDCKADQCGVQGVHLQDSLIQGLSCRQPQLLHACIFERVVLRGRIGSFRLLGPHPSLRKRDAFVSAMLARYQVVDWALDISEAEFAEVELTFLPGSLVRTDGETQIVLRRERLAGAGQVEMPEYASVWIRRFAQSPFDSMVVAAPRRSKHFDGYMRDIKWLIDAGWADFG